MPGSGLTDEGGQLRVSEVSEVSGAGTPPESGQLYRANTNNFDLPRRQAKTAETVAVAIVHDVVSRKLKPGDMLPSESVMRAEYGVSRASLREALRLLEVQGLIRLKPGPGGGPEVGEVDPRNLAQLTSLYLHLGGGTYRQLFEAQLHIAPLVARMAAANPDRELVRSRMSPFLVPDLPVEGDAYWVTTGSFHGRVEELSGNRVVELMARVISHLWNVHVATRMDTTPLRSMIHADHRKIAQAIIAGHETKAGRLMCEHYEVLQAEYARHWPARFEELIEWG